LQLKITLKEIKPPIWRRVLVSDQITLLDLHLVIQAVFGWEDYHLHEFKIRNVLYGDPEDSEFMDFVKEDEYFYKLSDFNFNKGSRFSYLYDFGDNWSHAVLVEKVLPSDKKARLPQFIDGKRATPPEDVGGEYAYSNFIEAINDPNHEEHENYLMWIGGDFDPESFDKNLVDYRCELIAQSFNEWNVRRNLWEEDPNDWVEPQLARAQWLKTLQERDLEKIKDLPLLRDVNTLLIYLRDNKVTGTSSTGNFSQKAVREFSVLMTVPPALKIEIGKYSHELKNEADVWPVYFVHLMVYWAELIDGGKGKVWQLTSKGKIFLESTPAEQLHMLFCGWWFRGDWLTIRLGFSRIPYLPPVFPKIVHFLLTSALSTKTIDRNDFCEQVIGALGYVKELISKENELEMICYEIEEIIIRPMEELGFIVGTHTESTKYGEIYKKLIGFQLSEFGREALRTMIDAAYYKNLKAKLN
jgi:hypothetical protein